MKTEERMFMSRVNERDEGMNGKVRIKYYMLNIKKETITNLLLFKFHKI